MIVGLAAVIVWSVSMWRRGGQFEGKMHRILALVGVVVCFGAYTFISQVALDKRVVSNYFGNISIRPTRIMDFLLLYGQSL